MSTQVGFDVDGLRRAIESGDAQYLIALYADSAKVRIFDSDHPRQAPFVVHGRAAVARWIEGRYGPDTSHRVVGASADADSVALVEEYHGADGGRGLWACSAEVAGGQIIRATAMVTAAEATPTSGPAGGRSETAVPSLDQPFLTRTGPARPAVSPLGVSAGGRSLPGNYLG
jgi:hypothetical protein